MIHWLSCSLVLMGVQEYCVFIPRFPNFESLDTVDFWTLLLLEVVKTLLLPRASHNGSIQNQVLNNTNITTAHKHDIVSADPLSHTDRMNSFEFRSAS